MKFYRVYCEGKEFGLDFTLEKAREIKKTFKIYFPNRKYYIRRIKNAPNSNRQAMQFHDVEPQD